MQLIDIGVNLTHQRLFCQQESITEKAKNVGVIHQIITGTSLESSRQAIQIAQTNPSYFSSTVGCHPHDAKDFKANDQQLLISLAEQSTVVAIGECGLDFNRNYSPQDVQQSVFEQQIDVAIKTNLPLFMHQRDAHQPFIAILSRHKNHFTSGVIHCFTGDKAQLKDCLDLGLYIGITGWLCDPKRNHDLMGAIKYLPLDRIMLETDSPYLTPKNIKPKRKSNTNVPENLPWVLEKLADTLKCSSERVAEVTTNNARNFFALAI